MLASCPPPFVHPIVTKGLPSVAIPVASTASNKAITANGNHHNAAATASKSNHGAESKPTCSSINDFTRWRPSSHLIAPKNWMNDPCGPCYDESTGLYHLLYQYNPQGATWGNMSWLHATSPDLVHWQNVNDEPSLVPEQEFDREGVFSGAMIPHGPKGEAGMLTVFYTAVSHLPIHFTKPYHWGSEKLAMATSRDGGISWQRSSSSVVLSSPPEEHQEDVVSWRDPFISAWPEMDDYLHLPRDQYVYGLISGGLLDKTPTAFLYRIEKNNLANWTFISTITDVGLNYALGSKSMGEMGRNWEVCNFFTLANGEGQFLLMNVEGVGEDLKSRHPMWTQVTFDEQQRSASTSSDSSRKVNLLPFKSGLVDHGCLYAASTFYHAQTNRRILWGWVTEDDLAESRYDQQGWSGCISLPREIIRASYTDVDPSTMADVDVQTAFETVGPNSLSTVGFRPARETQALREGAKHFTVRKTNFAGQYTLPMQSRSFELQLDIAIERALEVNDEVGVFVAHSADKSQGTRIVYRRAANDKEAAIYVIRDKSSSDPDVCREDVVAPLPLMRFLDGSIERVKMHIFMDNSVLEVFVNDRAVITTRIYCDADNVNLVSLINETAATEATTDDATRGQSNRAQIDTVEAWVGLQDAMLVKSELGPKASFTADGELAHL